MYQIMFTIIVLTISKSEWQIKCYVCISWLDLSLQNVLQHNRYQRRSTRSLKFNIVFPHTALDEGDLYQNKQRELTPRTHLSITDSKNCIKVWKCQYKPTNLQISQTKPSQAKTFLAKRILRNSYPDNINVTVTTRYARWYPPSIGGDSRPNQTLNDKWQNNYVYGCRNHFLHFDITLPDKALIFMWIVFCIHQGTPDNSHVQFSDGKK